MNNRYTALSFILAMSITSCLFAQSSITISSNANFPLCPGSDILLTAEATPGADSLVWTPEDILEVTADGTEAMFSGPRSAEVIATAFYPDTMVSDTFMVELFLAVVNISAGDTALNCFDESATMLTAEIEPATGTTISWTPAEGLNATNTASVMADPDSSLIYAVRVETGDGCVVTDTVFLQVDSIYRDMDITAVPGPMDPCMKYCPGEEVALFTQMADFNNFPRLEFEWTPKGSLTAGDSTQNTAIMTDVTTEYILTGSHGACTEMDSILIEVVDPSIPLSVTDTSICPGMPVNVSFDPTDLTDIEWMAEPEEGMQYLSCDDCPNPTIQIGNIGDVDVGGTFTFTVMAEKEMCCPAMGSVTITVVIEQEPTVQVETCPNVPVEINIDPTLTDIQWSDPMGNLSCDDCPNPTAVVETSQTFTYTALDDEACSVRGSANVQVLPPETILEEIIFYCPDEVLDLNISEFNLTNITWDATLDANLGCESCPDQTANPDPGFTYIVMFSGTDDDGCPVNGNFRLIPVRNAELRVDLDSGNTYSVGSLAPVTLSIDPVPDDLIVTWCFEGEEIPDIEGTNVELPVFVEGPNQYSAKLVDSFGCAREIEVAIVGVLPTIQIPKAFTPNNDDENDFFYPVITNASGSPQDLITDFKVFSRWGELVYDNDDNSVGWNGEQDGEAAPSDVYVYLITVTYPNQSTELFKGDVTLLR